MVASMMFPNEEPAERFSQIQDMFHRAAGKVGSLGFDNSTFLSERHCADRNISLMYFMVASLPIGLPVPQPAPPLGFSS